MPYPSIFEAWREIVPAVLRQVKDPAYHVKRKLPEPKPRHSEGACSSRRQAGPGGLGGSLRAPPIWPGGRHPLRPRQEDLRSLSRRRMASSTRPTDYARTATRTCRRPGEGRHRSSAPSTTGVSILSMDRLRARRSAGGWPLIRSRSANGRILSECRRAGGVGRALAEDVPLPRRQQPSVATFIKELVLEPADRG